MLKLFNYAALTFLKGRKFQLKSFNHRKKPVYYLEGGPKNAPTVTVLPGYGDTVFSWTLFLNSLAKDYHVVALDCPGYMGISPLAKDGSLFFDEIENVTKKFFSSVVHETDYLIGNSLGGWLTMRLGIAFTKKIHHLILVNAAGLLTTEEELKHIGSKHHIHSYRDFLELMKHFWHNMPKYFYGVSLMGYYQYTKRERFKDLFSSIQEHHFVNQHLEKLTMPVSVVWGTSDKLFHENMAKTLVELIPQATYYPIPQAGHMPQIEQPKKFEEVVRKILTTSHPKVRRRK